MSADELAALVSLNRLANLKQNFATFAQRLNMSSSDPMTLMNSVDSATMSDEDRSELTAMSQEFRILTERVRNIDIEAIKTKLTAPPSTGAPANSSAPTGKTRLDIQRELQAIDGFRDF